MTTTDKQNTPQEAVKRPYSDGTQTGDNLTAETSKTTTRPNNGPLAKCADVKMLPPTLKRNGKFCNWKFSWDGQRWTKVPYNPRTGGRAQSNNPETFADFEKAAAEQRQGVGLGVGAFGNIGGIDIDNCIAEDGKASALCIDIQKTIDSYTEVSPSGRGMRIFFIIPDNYKYDSEKYYIRNPHAEVEIYLPGMTNRFLTVTGDPLTPGKDLTKCTAEQLKTVLDKYMKRPEKTMADRPPVTSLNMSDTELLDRIRTSGDDKFFKLYNGDWAADYDSQSEADLSLCVKLAFWTQADPGQMERIFNGSELARRDKWQRRENYRRDTIAKALEMCGPVYDPEYYKDRDKAAKQKEAQEIAATVFKDDEPAADPDPEEAAADPIPKAETEEKPKETPDTMNEFLNKIYTGERYKPVPTGIKGLDLFLSGGIIPQSLVLLSAAPGAGKTAISTQVFENWARAGQRCIFLNLEMSKEQLLARSLSRIIYQTTGDKMSMIKILQGYRQSEDERRRVEAAAEVYRNEIDENLKYNPDQLGANLTRILEVLDNTAKAAIKAGHAAPCVCLDYLQILEGDQREDAAEMLKRAVTGLKNYATKYNTIVFAIMAQSRRASAEKDASMSAGRDTSALEYSGDLILQLKTVQGDAPDILTLFVTKSRFTKSDAQNGIKLKFAGGQSCIEEPDPWEKIKQKRY